MDLGFEHDGARRHPFQRASNQRTPTGRQSPRTAPAARHECGDYCGFIVLFVEQKGTEILGTILPDIVFAIDEIRDVTVDGCKGQVYLSDWRNFGMIGSRAGRPGASIGSTNIPAIRCAKAEAIAQEPSNRSKLKSD